MWCLTIRIKRNDQFHGKPLHKVLIEFLMESRISGATVWTGVDGFGKRRRSTIHLEGITINMPLVMEVIDEESRLDLNLCFLRSRGWSMIMVLRVCMRLKCSNR
ncbi:MAG: DUF190 domain-containing protein [Candidatus Nitrosopolaris sp.]